MSTTAVTAKDPSLRLYGSAENQFITDLSFYFNNIEKIGGIVYDFIEKAKTKKIEKDQVGNLRNLVFVPNLQNVTLDYCMKGEPDIQSLRACSRLKNLTLSYLDRLSDDHIDIIAKFPSLEFLSISSCSNLTEKAILPLANSKSLQILELESSLITKHLKEAVRKWIPVDPQDEELLEEGPNGNSLAARAAEYEELPKRNDPQYTGLANRIRRYIDYGILLSLSLIPNLKKVRLVGTITKQELGLIRSKLPNLQVESPQLDSQAFRGL